MNNTEQLIELESSDFKPSFHTRKTKQKGNKRKCRAMIAQNKMIILVDGFIMTNCMLMASKINPNVLHYAIYGHEGNETGHRTVLKALDAHPILNLGFRLGEGTGALCAYPIVDSAVRMINEMSSFKTVEVTKYF